MSARRCQRGELRFADTVRGAEDRPPKDCIGGSRDHTNKQWHALVVFTIATSAAAGGFASITAAITSTITIATTAFTAVADAAIHTGAVAAVAVAVAAAFALLTSAIIVLALTLAAALACFRRNIIITAVLAVALPAFRWVEPIQ
jgi:hypothetical protein